jgi:hypothetical protein
MLYDTEKAVIVWIVCMQHRPVFRAGGWSDVQEDGHSHPTFAHTECCYLGRGRY